MWLFLLAKCTIRVEAVCIVGGWSSDTVAVGTPAPPPPRPPPTWTNPRQRLWGQDPTRKSPGLSVFRNVPSGSVLIPSPCLTLALRSSPPPDTVERGPRTREALFLEDLSRPLLFSLALCYALPDGFALIILSNDVDKIFDSGFLLLLVS